LSWYHFKRPLPFIANDKFRKYPLNNNSTYPDEYNKAKWASSAGYLSVVYVQEVGLRSSNSTKTKSRKESPFQFFLSQKFTFLSAEQLKKISIPIL